MKSPISKNHGACFKMEVENLILEVDRYVPEAKARLDSCALSSKEWLTNEEENLQSCWQKGERFKCDMKNQECEDFQEKVACSPQEESKESQLKNEIEETRKATHTAMNELNRNINHLLECVTVLREKHAQLNDGQGNVQTIEDLVTSLQRKEERIASDGLVTGAERELLEGRLSRLTTIHHVAKENLEAKEIVVSGHKNELASLQSQTKLIEQLAGVKCLVMDDQTLEVAILNDDQPSLVSDQTFVATLLFTLDEDENLVLSKVETNQEICLPSETIKSAIADNDLPKVVTVLKEIWHTARL